MHGNERPSQDRIKKSRSTVNERFRESMPECKTRTAPEQKNNDHTHDATDNVSRFATPLPTSVE